MMLAGMAAATSAVPTRATIQVSMKPITVAEAIETIIGRARCRISRSPAREGNLITVQQRTVTVNREGGSSYGDTARSEENQSRRAQAGHSGEEATPADPTCEPHSSSAGCDTC